MTPQDVAERLRKAAHTIFDMPPGPLPGTWGAGAMPEPLVDFWAMWNGLTTQEREERAKEFNHVRITPSAQEIRDMDEALGWLLWIKQPANRRIISGVMFGASFRTLARFDKEHRSHETMRRIWKQGCQHIAWLLARQRTPKPARRGAMRRQPAEESNDQH